LRAAGFRIPVAELFEEVDEPAMVETRPISVHEFETLPREGIWELIDGELIEVSPTGGVSGWVNGLIYAALLNHSLEGSQDWVLPPETGFVLFPDRDTVRAPDAAVVLRERLDALPRGFIPLAPDLAVEVLSPSDRLADALEKVRMYLDAGVRLVWLVDPDVRSVTAYRPGAAPVTLHAGDTLDGGDVLPEFRLPLTSIFG
jgi:Uma2 family endonuclease